MYKQLKNLYKLSFNDSEKYIDYFFQKKTNPNCAVSLIDKGQVVSALHLIDKTMRIRSVDINVPFMVAAATLPQLRGKKLLEKVMLMAFSRLNIEQSGMTVLYPFNHNYYTKYGFTNVTYIDEMSISNIDDCAMRVATTPQVLMQIYDEFTMDKNCYVRRDIAAFEQYLEEWACDDIAPRIYSYNGSLCYIVDVGDGNCEVCGNIETLRHVKCLDGLKCNVVGNTLPFLQARLISPIEILKKIKYDNDVDLYFTLVDEFFEPNNNLSIHLKVDNSIVSCQIVDGEYAKIDIVTLTQAVCGVNADYGILNDALKPKSNYCADKY